MHEKISGLKMSEQLQSTVQSPIGIQIIPVGKLEHAIAKNPNLINSLFTQEEKDYCGKRLDSFAGRLAAKVSIMKIMQKGLAYQDINIPALPTKQPIVTLSGQAQECADAQGIQGFSVTISHDEGLAASLIIPLTENLPEVKPGIDIVSSDRFMASFDRHPQRFLQKIFTPAETQDASHNVTLLAQKWAAKEAVAKALGTGLWRQDVGWKDIELLGAKEGYFKINLSGGAKRHAEKQGLTNWTVYTSQYKHANITFVIAY